MSNINLYQTEEAAGKSPKASLFDKGLLVGGIVFVLVLAGFGGIKLYLKSLDEKVVLLKSEIVSSKDSLVGKDVDLAASFNQRLGIMKAKKEGFASQDPALVFENIQGSMVKGVVASDIDVQGKSLKIVFLADSFEILAKQILSFKSFSENGRVIFQDVQVKSSVLDEDKKVRAELNMMLNI